jgi:hypothetical protein
MPIAAEIVRNRRSGIDSLDAPRRAQALARMFR